MRGKLTKRSVESAKSGSVDVFMWDTELRGFGVKVTPKNHRVFIAQYWSPTLHRVRRRATLGAFGTLTVDQARTAAQRLLGRVANGEDPAAETSAHRGAAKDATVSALSAEYLEDIKEKVQPSTGAQYAQLFKVNIIPALGKKPVAQVTLRDAAALHSSKSKQPYQANRVLNLLGAFLNWTEKRGYRARHSNPCRDVQPYPERQRERFLSAVEIGRLGAALSLAERTGLAPAPNLKRKPSAPEKAKHRPTSADTPIPANPFAIAAIRFLLLTGWREQEALTLQWAEIDLSRGAATLPNTKTGKSHRPLGAPAIALLATLERLEGSPYVFPGARAGHPLREIKRVWSAARHAAGLEGVRLHDLRHTVASFAMGSGHSLFIVGKLLGHSRAETTNRYAHLSEDARKAAADDVSGSIAAALWGEQPTEVIPLAVQQR